MTVVLQSFKGLRATTNPYLHQLVTALPPEIIWLPFSWRTALLGRYDVLHVHWFEVLLRGRDRRRTVARQVAATLLLARLLLSRTPVVRTMHNLQPHETGGRYERLLTAVLGRLTRVRIVLNNVDELPDVPSERILHGHYRDWFAGFERQAPSPGSMVHVGLIRRYKNVDGLITAFTALADKTARLRLVGSCEDEDLRALIERTADADHRLSHQLTHVDDSQLVHEVTKAALVVLPYKELHNSGAVLLALSLDRPVLVPDGPSARALADEVGRDWVLTFSHPLTPQALERALTTVQSSALTSPDLSARTWQEAGRRHADAYLRACSRPVQG